MQIVPKQIDAVAQKIRRLEPKTQVARPVLSFGAPEIAASARRAKHSLPAVARNGLLRFLSGLCTGGIIATFSLPVSASPLPQTSFNRLASSCAPGVELPTLRAVAAVESHFEPWAIQDNTTHEAWTPPSVTAAVVLAEDRLRKGHSLDLGLMQINSGNLASLGLGVNDAFDPCRSLNAAHRILLAGFAAGSSEAERQAAILITLSRYNTGRPLAGIANGYVNRVIAAQSDWPTGKAAQQDPNMPPQWNIWGTSGAAPSSWVVTTNGTSEIERAGARSTDAREVRAAATSTTKGEPHGVLAYEIESNQP
jgi:type IV secretion system protein VirB1